MKLRCIAIDDEPFALEMVCNFIKQTPFLELIAFFDNGIDALQHVRSNSVDLIFLDIQMADLSGMQVARILASDKTAVQPLIVFTTAYSEFAIEGFRVDALDYLLKPFDYEDFLKSANKAKKQLSKDAASVPLGSGSSLDYIFVKVDSQIVKLMLVDILYFEGDKDYIKIHLKSSTSPVLSLMNLKKVEELLVGKDFLRIHRSYIVSLAQAEALLKKHVKIGGKMLPVGGQYKQKYDNFINKWIG